MTKKAVRGTISLPVGRIAYPFLVKTDSGREYSDDSYGFDLIITKSVWNSVRKKDEKGRSYRQVAEDLILEVARDLTGKPKLTFKEVTKHFIKDLESDPKTPANLKDCIMIRCKSKPTKNGPAQRPLIVGLELNSNKGYRELTADQVATLKGGDYCDAVVDVFGYSQSGGGVTCRLVSVRFIKAGEPFGHNAAAKMGLFDDIEVTEDAFTDEQLATLAKSA